VQFDFAPGGWGLAYGASEEIARLSDSVRLFELHAFKAAFMEGAAIAISKKPSDV
jgi:hypothetical protein